MRYKLLAVLLLVALPLVADCQYSTACPYDGDQMTNTWNCKGVGDSRACEYKHTKQVYEGGQSRTVTHTTWVSCPS